MGEIKTSKMLWAKKAVGREHSGSVKFSITGKKGFFTRHKYRVLVEWNGLIELKKKGDYQTVRNALLKKEHRIDGIGLLKQVANAIKEPEAPITYGFTDKEMLCLCVLIEGPKTIRQLTHTTAEKERIVVKALKGLVGAGIVKVTENFSQPNVYELTEKGNDTIDTILTKRAMEP